jgi:hypothetical protein
MQNRRQYSRVPFQSEARLILADGEHTVDIVDLSLKGALVRLPSDGFIQVGSHGTLSLALDADETLIRMGVTVVHHQGTTLGLASRDIDLDSVTHLRHLLAVNLGDEALLERELSQFTTR